jgi:hypothetical protein
VGHSGEKNNLGPRGPPTKAQNPPPRQKPPNASPTTPAIPGPKNIFDPEKTKDDTTFEIFD